MSQGQERRRPQPRAASAGRAQLVLLVVTAVVVVGAFLALRQREAAAAPAEAAGPLYPELLRSVNDAARLVVASAEGTVTLQRQGEGWSVQEWNGYPADVSTVHAVLRGLTQLERQEAKTSRPELYGKLGLSDPSAEGSRGTRVTVTSERGALLADLVVGDSRPGRTPGLYVRKADEAGSWLVSGTLNVPKGASDWVEKGLLELPLDRVVSAEVRHPDGEVVRVDRQPGVDDGWQIADLPEGSRPKYDGVARPVANALGYLTLESVVQPGEVDLTEAEWTETRVRTREGLVAVVHTARVDDKDYARLSFELAAPEPVAQDGADTEGTGPDGEQDVADAAEEAAAAETGEAGPTGEAGEVAEDGGAALPTLAPGEDGDAAAALAESPAEPSAETVAERDRLAARHASWTYVIGRWKADALRKRLSDLVDSGGEAQAAGDELALPPDLFGDLAGAPPEGEAGESGEQAGEDGHDHGAADDDHGGDGHDHGAADDTGEPSDGGHDGDSAGRADGEETSGQDEAAALSAGPQADGAAGDADEPDTPGQETPAAAGDDGPPSSRS